LKILKVSNPDAITTAINVLNDGGIIVYPTDTLYGFGADATNYSAIEKIYIVKGRTGPISVLVSDIDTAISLMDIDIHQIDLVQLYLGGPKTLIVPVKHNVVSKQILGENSSLGIRIPSNKFCIELSKKFGKPITSTSVNRTNREAINNSKQIVAEFENEIDLLIDSGTLPNSSGSTIYQLKDNNIIILRK
jgi:L-threonylcarbamoyladenylate synthase